MSLDFDGVNDVVDTSATVTLGSTVTIAAWIDPDSTGEVNLGTLLNHTGRMSFTFNGSALNRKMRLFTIRSTTNGTWDMTTSMSTFGSPRWVAVTYDWSSVTNDPIMYLYDAGVFSTLTVGSGLTEVSTPAGSEAADNQILRAGNVSSGAQTWDGRIGEWAVWTRVLSANDIKAVLALGVLSQPNSLAVYWPMDNTGAAQATDFSGNGRDGTVTGAVVAANPPARPAGRR